MCLLPFSTGGGEGSNSVVVTFAFPFLLFLTTSIVYNFINRRNRTFYPKELKLSILLALFHVLSILISSLMNQEPHVAFARSIFHLFGFIIFLYITSNASTTNNAALVYDKISMIFVLSGFIMSAYFIGNFIFAVQQNSLEQALLERAKGGLLALPWGVSNTIAACLMMPLFSALDRLVNTNEVNSKNNKLTLFMMLTMIFAIIVTQSRAVIITLTIGMTLIGTLTKNRKLILLFFVMVAAILLGITSVYGQELEGIVAERIGDVGSTEGFNGRTSVWEESAMYFSQNPLQPLGYFGMLGAIGHTAHNILMTTVIEQGVFGLIAYTFFTISNFSFCKSKLFIKYLPLATKRRAVFYIIAMLSIFVQLQFEDSNLTAQNIVYQWIFLSLMYLSAYADDVIKPVAPKYYLAAAKSVEVD